MISQIPNAYRDEVYDCDSVMIRRHDANTHDRRIRGLPLEVMHPDDSGRQQGERDNQQGDDIYGLRDKPNEREIVAEVLTRCAPSLGFRKRLREAEE